MFEGNRKIADALGFGGYKVDIHSHILPEFDDGSRNIEETLSLAREIRSGGTDVVIWTPHLNHPRYECITSERIVSHFNRYKDLVESESGIKLVCGSEMYFGPSMKDKILPLGETNYVLVEFDYVNYPLYLKEVLYDIQISGYEIIFAHVERYKWLCRFKKSFFRKKFDFSLAEELKNRNIMFQMNFSHLNRVVESSFERMMLKQDMVEFMGSDKHRIDDGRKVIIWSDLWEKEDSTFDAE